MSSPELQAWNDLIYLNTYGAWADGAQNGGGATSPRKITPRMSALSPDMQMVARVRKKFERLEETCMQRYQSREQHVIATLNFCMTALEQLQSWALFAIFPLDEQNSDKYLAFVEQRFQCVVNPLRLFLTALNREQNPVSNGVGTAVPPPNGRRSPRTPRQSPTMDHSPRDSGRGSPNFGDFRLDRSRDFRETLSDGSANSRDSASLNSSLNTTGSHDSGAFVDPKSDSLRDRISTMSIQYIEEGQSVRKAVVGKLQKCRKDMRIIYRWGQASLLDLNDVIDESLSDELYFMVRGKMQRILSDISVFEEAADQIEKNLSHYFQTPSKEKPHDDLGIDTPEFVMEFPRDFQAHSRESPRYESMELRLDLDGVEEVGVPITPRFGSRDDITDSGDSTRGSTPEPPTSPRPKGLVNHPKIMKDKLQSYALPSKFTGLMRSSPW